MPFTLSNLIKFHTLERTAATSNAWMDNSVFFLNDPEQPELQD